MNPHLNDLHPYPFEKLNRLKQGSQPPAHLTHIALSIGEPKHVSPKFVKQTVTDHLDKLANYPTTKGTLELRQTICHWLETRFNLEAQALNPDQHVLPVNGTREALFAFTQAMVDTANNPLIISPNPFYQIYEGAAILAGAEPVYLNCTADNHFIPDLDMVSEDTWQRCQILHLCSPGNPTGAVMSLAQFKHAIELADRYDFIIVSDECYSELYFDEASPPPGLLQACQEMGRTDFDCCVVFHSLSKRSNLPGLRSGFVAGDGKLIQSFFKYRTYHGCAMPLPTQIASRAAWEDEQHVRDNRTLYREKFAAVTQILDGVLDFPAPEASFYLWPETPIDDVEFARRLFQQQNVTVLPGQFLSRETATGNPGKNRVRMALVAEIEECIEAAQRIKTFVESL